MNDEDNPYIKQICSHKEGHTFYHQLVRPYQSLCARCGTCCTKVHIKIMPAEAKRIARYLKLSQKQFRRRYHIQQHGTFYGTTTIPCPFLDATTCTIHDVRPWNCIIFPFYHYYPHTLRLNNNIVKSYDYCSLSQKLKEMFIT